MTCPMAVHGLPCRCPPQWVSQGLRCRLLDAQCPNCGSDRPGQHYQDGCPGDATLRRLEGRSSPDWDALANEAGQRALEGCRSLPLTEQALEDAVREIDKSGPTLDVAFWRLANENEPNGMVVGVNKYGQETVWMPREDWEQIRASLTAQTCGGCGLKCLDAHGQCRACGARKGQAREPWVPRVKR